MKMNNTILTLTLLIGLGACGSERTIIHESSSCSVKATPEGSLISCTDGSSALVENGSHGLGGMDGAKGQDGLNGTNGVDGQDGANGVDGANGQDGQDGEDAIAEIIDPCGDGPGIDEVLIKLSSGEILAWLKNVGLVVLVDGNYQTTDKQKCSFSIVNGEVID